MNVWENILVALEGLLANKLRSALTALGVIIGVCAVITMLALASGASAKVMSQIQQLGTNVLFIMAGQSRNGPVMGGMGSNQTLTLEDAEAIADHCPSVIHVSPEVGGSAQVKYRNQNTNTTITGITPDFLEARNYQIAEGKFISKSDVRALRKVAVIGATTATNLFGDRSPLGKDITVKGIRFTVIGLMAVKGAGGFGDADDAIFIPITTAMNRVFGLNNVRMICAQAGSIDLMDQASTEITNLLRKRHRISDGEEDDFNIRNQADMMQAMNSMSTTLALLLGGIAGVSLLVGGIGIMNIMLVSVTERTREIGIRMALGARQNDILGQFLVEALVLSLLGGGIGVLLGMIASLGLGKAMDMPMGVTMQSVLLSFGFSAVVGIAFGIIPAYKASRLRPIEALRYE